MLLVVARAVGGLGNHGGVGGEPSGWQEVPEGGGESWGGRMLWGWQGATGSHGGWKVSRRGGTRRRGGAS